MKYVSVVGISNTTKSRARILEAAKACLRRHGSDRLTVTDVARSLGMSHANVYRFFKSKSDILDAIIDEWLTLLESFIEEIAARPLPAAKRIELVVVDLHRKRKQKLLEDAEVFETFKRVVELRPELMAQRRARITAMFRRLLEKGMETGEFKKLDAEAVAVALKDATALFLHPFLIPTILSENTEARAQKVVQYLLAGFLAEKSVLRKASNGKPKRSRRS
ncbi:MAG: TetR family transcriptional regulatory protein [Verrucomicrobiales bacterium]|nr:TetR family transcriptional regulatory protein [Verrucomicrobiales bacterium]